MSTREQKFIDLKILLCVNNIEELAQHSKLFKKYGVEINFDQAQPTPQILLLATPMAREISWLFHQLAYVFQEDEEMYFDLVMRLRPFLKNRPSINKIVDFTLDCASAVC